MTQIRSSCRYELGVVGAIFLFAGLLRFPFMFEYVIDWDESTYILLARSILEGGLLYRELWDSKPPLGLVTLAGAMTVFGDSIVSVRIVGLLGVAASAYLVHRFARALADARTAMLATAIYIVSVTAIGSGQATMLEHIAVPMVLAALLLSLRSPVTPFHALAVGTLVACATLTRTNLGILAPVLGAWLFACEWPSSRRRAFETLTAYSAGGLAVVAICLIPYLISGELDLLFYTLVKRPLLKSADSAAGSAAWLTPLRYATGVRLGISPFNHQLWLAALLWAPAVAGFTLLVGRSFKHGTPSRRLVGLLLIGSMAVAVSIGATGEPWPHHLLQLAPFAAIAAAVLFTTLLRPPFRPAAMALLATLLAGTVQTVPVQYWRMFTEWRNGHYLMGDVNILLQFLRPRCDNGCTVFLLADHVAYWILDKPVLTRVAHPSTLARQDLYDPPVVVAATPRDELAAIFAKHPTFVLTRAELPWLTDDRARRYLQDELRRSYRLVLSYCDRRLYRLQIDDKGRHSSPGIRGTLPPPKLEAGVCRDRREAP
jgi:4-amino-4-deoxy-L-arabinose transferase-like glycosyltransferase